MKAPYFWNAGLDPRSREAAPLTRALLTPFAALYRYGVQRKLRNAQPAHVEIPVICVGNLTVGGVGKTPIVTAIRARLAADGLRAASLSRGYGGTLQGVLRVDPDKHTAKDVGDEPLMLAQSGESWIGADRPAAARAMQAAGVEVIIMDDGHQNPSLAKDLSIIVIDAQGPFGNGYLIPKGPLREPVAFGLARADAVILMGDGETPGTVAKSGLPAYHAKLAPIAALPDGPLVAFAGIGRPLKFFDALTAAGAQLSEGVSYGDHHVYSEGDMRYLRSLAQSHNATLITTEKDYARLSSQQRADIKTFPVRAVFDMPGALDKLLMPILSAK